MAKSSVTTDTAPEILFHSQVSNNLFSSLPAYTVCPVRSLICCCHRLPAFLLLRPHLLWKHSLFCDSPDRKAGHWHFRFASCITALFQQKALLTLRKKKKKPSWWQKEQYVRNIYKLQTYKGQDTEISKHQKQKCGIKKIDKFTTKVGGLKITPSVRGENSTCCFSDGVIFFSPKRREDIFFPFFILFRDSFLYTFMSQPCHTNIFMMKNWQGISIYSI